MNKVIGIDIGATSMKGAFVQNNEIKNKVEIFVNHELGLEGFKISLYEIVDKLLKIDDADLIGVSSVGNIDVNTGLIVGSTSYTSGLNGFNVKEFIEKNFNKKTYVDTDSMSPLIAEMEYGVGKGYKNVCMLTLGTGVGGAVIVDNKPLRGTNYRGGFLGHMTLYPNGKKCSCGRYGCAEEYISGRAFTEGARALGYEIKNGKEVFEYIKKGDKTLEKYSIDFFKNLVYVCESLENIFDPDLVIIGGGLSNSYDDWKEYFNPYIKDLRFKVLPASFKNDAGIIGAATVALKGNLR